MAAGSVTDTHLLDILSKLEPGEDLDQSLRQLLIQKARNDLVKYRLVDRGFRKEYGMDFPAFKASEKMKKPPYKVEQDYFDWELSVTMIEELEGTLKDLERANA